jgi:flagellin-specific chaperone FliS
LYVYRELNQINLKNDLESLGKVMEIVKNLHASWQEIMENNPEATVAAKRQQSRLENMSIVG